MKHSFASSMIAIFLMVALIAPSVLIAIPSRVHAQAEALGVPTAELPISMLSIQQWLDTIADVANEINTYAQFVNTWILQPIALIKSIGLQKAMTVGVLAFISGNANGTGASQFLKTLQGTLQKVGDTQAVAFFSQFGKNSNSPFKASIAAAAKQNYLRLTNMAGFWADMRCTLSQSSPDAAAFLSGNWSKGGVQAWLSLATRSQNNPYSFYNATVDRSRLLSMYAQEIRKTTANWGQGMMSWCGTTDSEGNAQASTPDPGAGAEGDKCDFTDSGSADGTWQGGHCVANSGVQNGINPGDPCVKKDGTPGQIKTPGSVIQAGLTKVLGAGQDKLTQFGNMASSVSSIIQSIVGVMQTIELAKNIFKGPSSGGLTEAAGLAASGSGGWGNGAYSNLEASTTAAFPKSDAAVTTMRDRITKINSVIQTINATADAATSVINTQFIPVCTAYQAEATSAKTKITNLKTSRVAVWKKMADDATVIVNRIEAEKNTDPGKYGTDLQALSTMSPTSKDVDTITNEGNVSGGAAASPARSLVNISGGSIVDQFTLIGSNASARARLPDGSKCAPDSAS